MTMQTTPRNYDPLTFLYWYRKVGRHPDHAIDSLAEDFRDTVASGLGIYPPPIFWFDDADFREASQAWSAHPSPKKKQSPDPLREPCEYFRWPGTRDRGYCGYAHQQSPLGIMINVCRRDEHLLNTVAEECFHIYQDIKYGSGWRARPALMLLRERPESSLDRRPVRFAPSWSTGRV